MLRGVANTARRVLAIYENETYNFEVNGEAEVIERLRPFDLRVAIDVGVYEGEWTRAVRASHPAADVHCFEASPAVAATLRELFADDPKVTVNHLALGPAEEMVTLHVDSLNPSLTSVVASDSTSTTPVDVPMRRGDDYLREHGIEHVDLLKIDTEGFDLNVLRGFSTALESARVTVVQFEYNKWAIRSRALLVDYYQLLEPLGYRLGKVHPDGVDFRDYDPSLENWIGPACVAVHESRPEIIRALGLDPA